MKNMNDHFIVDRRFHHAVIRIYSLLPFCRQDLATMTLLIEMLQNKARGYRSQDQIMAQCESFYALDFDCSHAIMDEYILFSLTFRFIDEKMVSEKGLLEKILRFLKRIVYDVDSSRFTKKLMKEQQKILINKLKQYYDRPRYIVQHGLFQALDANWPISLSPYGTEEDILQVTKEDLLDLHQRLVDAPRSYYYIGPYTKSRVKKAMERYFGHSFSFPKRQRYQPKITEPITIIKEKENLQSELLFAYRFDQDYGREALHLFNDILGVSGNNRLFQDVREKRGLCYQVSSSFLPYYRLLLISVAVDQTKIEETKTAVQECLMHFRVKQKELLEAKRMVRSEIVMQFDQAESILMKQIRHEQEGIDLSKASLLKRYRLVNLKQLHDIAKHITYLGCYILKGVKK